MPRIAVAEYVGLFPGRESHGNNEKQNTKYIRTKPSIIDNLKEAIREKPNLHVWQDVVAPDEIGGPRSRKQLINLKYNEKKKREREHEGEVYRANLADHLQNLETMVKTDGSFVRCVKLSENRVPAAVLYSDQQLEDIKRFCFSSPEAKTTYFGFDKTFNLSDLHVTAGVYKNLAVKSKTTGDHPLFLGPILIHGNSDFETYHFFFSELSSRLRGVSSKPVFGFDDESALHGALRHVFHECFELYCTRHLKENVVDYMKVINKTVQAPGVNKIIPGHINRI